MEILMPDPQSVPDPSEFQSTFDHFKLVEQSKRRHPELTRTTRPTVDELIRGAAVVKKRIDLEDWPDTKGLCVLPGRGRLRPHLTAGDATIARPARYPE